VGGNRHAAKPKVPYVIAIETKETSMRIISFVVAAAFATLSAAAFAQTEAPKPPPPPNIHCRRSTTVVQAWMGRGLTRRQNR
jgi:hypothetical protein